MGSEMKKQPATKKLTPEMAAKIRAKVMGK